MRHVVVASHGPAAVGVEFSLEDVGKHLDVVSPCAIAFCSGEEDVASVAVEVVAQSDLRQQLVEVVACVAVEGRGEGVSGFGSHYVCRHCHVGRGVIVDAYVVVVVSESECGDESRCEIDVRLVEDGEVVVGSVEGARCLHVDGHAHSPCAFYGSSSCCECCFAGHTCLHHSGCHRVEHCVVHGSVYGVGDGSGEGFVEVDGCPCLQP